MGTATAERTPASRQVPTNLSPETQAPGARQRHGGRSGQGRLRMVVGNTVISLVGQGVTWISTLILTIAYGRFLGPSRLGELYLAITLVGLIGFPLEFGFNQQIIRDVARAPERSPRYITSALLLKLALWVPLLGLLILATGMLRYSPDERALVVICGATLLMTSLGAAFGSMHIAVHRNFAPVIGTILEKTLDAAIAFSLLRYWHIGVITVAFVLLGGATISAIWQAAWYFGLERPRLTLDLSITRKIVLTSIPFLVYGVLGVIYYRVDTVMLGAMDGDTVVGWYGAGYRIFDTLIFLPSLVMSTIMYPLMARLSDREPQAFRVAVEKATNFLLVVGVPLAVGLATAAPAIVGFLYHQEDFSHTVAVIQFLAPGLILLYMNTVISSIIISIKHERRMTVMAAAALILNVSLNFVLIPHFHEVAAAGVTSLTELVLLAIGLCMIPRELIPLGSVPTLLKALLASAAMAGVIVALSSFSILVILPAACLAYAVMGLVLRLIPREDARALLSAVRSKAAKSESEPVAALAAVSAKKATLSREAYGEPSPNSMLKMLTEIEAATASYRVGHSLRALRTLTPERAAVLQAFASASERARVVTRTRSTSAPLTAAQRATVVAAVKGATYRLTSPSAPTRRSAPATVKLASAAAHGSTSSSSSRWRLSLPLDIAVATPPMALSARNRRRKSSKSRRTTGRPSGRGGAYSLV